MKTKPRDAYAFGDDPVVEDGGSVRVPMMLCDSLAGYRPGFVQLSDEQIKARWENRDEMIRKAQDSWRGPIARPIETATAREDESARWKDLADGRRRKPPDDDEDDDDDDTNDVRAPARKARDAYVRQLQDAWRTPAPDRLTSGKSIRDGAEPDNSSSRFVRGSDDPDGAQAKRDQAYEEYAASITQAWKNPPGAAPPAPASRVERIGEQTRGGR